MCESNNVCAYIHTYIHTLPHPHTYSFSSSVPETVSSIARTSLATLALDRLFLYSSQAVWMHRIWVIWLLPPFVISSVRFRVYVCLIYWRICVVDLSNRIFLSILSLFLYTLHFPMCSLDALVTQMYFQLLLKCIQQNEETNRIRADIWFTRYESFLLHKCVNRYRNRLGRVVSSNIINALYIMNHITVPV